MASGDQIDILRPADFTPEKGLSRDPGKFLEAGGILGRPLQKGDGWQALVRVPSGGTPLGTGLTVQVATADEANNSDPSKVYRLGLSFKKIASGTDNLGSSGFGTESTADVTANATTGVATLTNIAVTTANADAPSAGDLLLMRIRRIGTHANDTHSGVPVLLGATVRDT